jgi:hypothetical protein
VRSTVSDDAAVRARLRDLDKENRLKIAREAFAAAEEKLGIRPVDRDTERWRQARALPPPDSDPTIEDQA